MKKSALFIMVVLILSSCSMPETKVYTLSFPASENLNSKPSDSTVSIVIHELRYLEQPYIAHRVSQYQIEVSRYSKWESAPNEIVKKAFRDALIPLFKEVRISGYAPEGSYLLDINLKKFERTETENVSLGELAFDVKLFSPEGNEIYKNTVSKSIKLEAHDNSSLAKALSSALSSAIEEVRNSISSKMSKSL